MTEQTTPDNADRRARYAGALKNVRMLRDGKNLDRQIDAILTVADAEQAQLRAEQDAARRALFEDNVRRTLAEDKRHIDRVNAENEQLRTELDEAREQCTEMEQQHQFTLEEARGRALNGRAAGLREAAARYEEMLANATPEQDPRYWTAVRDITLGLRNMAAETQPAVEAPPTPKPTVAYSGLGRTFCVTCPHPDNENVPLTIDDVNNWDLCARCNRHVIDVARQAAEA